MELWVCTQLNITRKVNISAPEFSNSLLMMIGCTIRIYWRKWRNSHNWWALNLIHTKFSLDILSLENLKIKVSLPKKNSIGTKCLQKSLRLKKRSFTKTNFKLVFGEVCLILTHQKWEVYKLKLNKENQKAVSLLFRLMVVMVVPSTRWMQKCMETLMMKFSKEEEPRSFGKTIINPVQTREDAD